MDVKTVYTITKKGDSIIDKSILNLDDWLRSLKNKEFNFFLKICKKQLNNRTEEENFLIFKYALLIYCRELDILELSLNEKFLNKINKVFSASLLVEEMRKKNEVEYDSKLFLYKECYFKITKTKKKKK